MPWEFLRIKIIKSKNFYDFRGYFREVFKKIRTKEECNQTSIGHKESKDVLEEYFFDVLPDYDEDRVYASDIKKIIRWYNLLEKHNMLNFEETIKTSDEEE